jgi:hypothetical protein
MGSDILCVNPSSLQHLFYFAILNINTYQIEFGFKFLYEYIFFIIIFKYLCLQDHELIHLWDLGYPGIYFSCIQICNKKFNLIWSSSYMLDFNFQTVIDIWIELTLLYSKLTDCYVKEGVQLFLHHLPICSAINLWLFPLHFQVPACTVHQGLDLMLHQDGVMKICFCSFKSIIYGKFIYLPK